MAEYLQELSMGQLKQFVELPAAVGLRALLNNCSEPEEVTELGMWAGVETLGAGEHRSHKRRSISWQDLVRSDGAVVDSFRQLPLNLLAIASYLTRRFT